MCENFKLVPLSGARSDVWQHFGIKVNGNGDYYIKRKSSFFVKIEKRAVVFGYSGSTRPISNHIFSNVQVQNQVRRTV